MCNMTDDESAVNGNDDKASVNDYEPSVNDDRRIDM